MWADGRFSWVQSENLPAKLQEHFKKGEKYEQHAVSINELGRTRTELTQAVKDAQVLDNGLTVKRYHIVMCCQINLIVNIMCVSFATDEALMALLLILMFFFDNVVLDLQLNIKETI